MKKVCVSALGLAWADYKWAFVELLKKKTEKLEKEINRESIKILFEEKILIDNEYINKLGKNALINIDGDIFLKKGK